MNYSSYFLIKRAGSLFFALALTFLFSNSAFAQKSSTAPYSIRYELSMPNPASHLFEIKMMIETPKTEPGIEIQMPRWSPGRYAVVDFAKGVQEVSAFGTCPPQTKCKAVVYPVERVDTQTWRVQNNGDRRVTVTYKVFANNLSGTFSQLDERHANYNGGTIFMYAVDHKPDPVSLKITAPANWKIINGRMENLNQTEWRFDNYDILIDTPTEIAPDFTVDQFTVGGKVYKVMIHSFADEGGKRAQFVKDVQKIVEAETAMMGTPDYDSYTFMFHFAPKNEMGGDGMEHLSSTQIIETAGLGTKEGYQGAIDTAAHEFFHVWNVKRLRPVGLGPWDFTKPVNTRGLFIAEGFTNYYGKMLLHRAGLSTDKELLADYGNTMTYIESSPGSKLMTAIEASLVAPFLDRASRVQQTNLAATTVSYYPKGELVAFALDLMIRKRSNGAKSLDDVMRKMYEDFYLKSPKNTYYLKGRGYTVEDFERVTSEVTGTNMSDFFTKYVRDVQMPPYDEGLEFVGMKLTRTEINRNNMNLTQYKIEEIPNASAQARARGAAWLKGNR